jgi:surface polysaccharide O-acyltransferase-like enzyme
MVVLLHSTVGVEEYTSSTSKFGALQRYISFGLCQIAVPFFFIISGYLFFFRTYKKHEVKKNIYKRRKTLLIPYLGWCFIWFIIVYLVQSVPALNSYFEKPLSSMGFEGLIMQLLYYPLNYPFWFLRELLLIVLLTPLIFLFNKNNSIIFLIVVFLLNLFSSSLIYISSIDINIFSLRPLFYFSLGAFIGINKYVPNWKISKFSTIIIFTSWLLFNVIYFNLNEISVPLKVLFSHTKDLLGIIALWQIYDIKIFKNNKIFFFYKYSFFIFAFHGLSIIYLKEFLKLILPNEPLVHFGIYLFSFLFVLLLSTLIAFLIDKYINKFYLILTGFR